MKNPCKDSNLISKGIEYGSLIFGFVILCEFLKNDSGALFKCFTVYVVIKNIFYYLNKRFLKFPEKIGMGVSEKSELWCQKNLKLSSKDYALFLITSQKRREISFVLSLILSTSWWISACFYYQISPLEFLYSFQHILPLSFFFGYPIGFAYGAWKYRHVEKPDYGNGNYTSHMSNYGKTGDMGAAIALSSLDSRR
jgi:hypothetical protein